jgi:hypothetical protein
MFELPASPRHAFGVFSSVSVLGLALVGAHCASKASAGPNGSCTADPTVCSAGETCWPTSLTTLGCLASQKGVAVGAACTEAYNQVTCGDGMLCDATDTSGIGQCVKYCGPAADCPTGYSCQVTQVGTGGPTVHVCRIAAVTPDGGGDGGWDGETYDEGGELPDISYIPDVALDVAPAHQ